jgi:hypothetical protein
VETDFILICFDDMGGVGLIGLFRWGGFDWVFRWGGVGLLIFLVLIYNVGEPTPTGHSGCGSFRLQISFGNEIVYGLLDVLP